MAFGPTCQASLITPQGALLLHFYLTLQVLKGEWAGREGEVQALADEREAIVNVAGAAERATQILDRADLGRVVKDGEADDCA